jgi:hypothetical protein
MCWWLLLLLLWCCCNQTASNAVLVLVLDSLSALTRSPLRLPGAADLDDARAALLKKTLPEGLRQAMWRYNSFWPRLINN